MAISIPDLFGITRDCCQLFPSEEVARAQIHMGQVVGQGEGGIIVEVNKVQIVLRQNMDGEWFAQQRHHAQISSNVSMDSWHPGCSDYILDIPHTSEAILVQGLSTKHFCGYDRIRAALLDNPGLPCINWRYCVACGKISYTDFMVHDLVWSQTGVPPNGGRLHYHCVESRLGRKLTIEDFTEFPINDGIRFGFMLAMR